MKLILAFLLGIAFAMSSLAQPPATAGAEKMLVQIRQVVPGGAIADVVEKPFEGSSLNKKYTKSGKPVPQAPRLIFLTGAEGLADRERLRIEAKRDGNHTYATRTYEQWVITKRVDTK